MYISVIIITYNNESIIERCVNSIALQLKQKDEIIVFDNGSTDGTKHILENMMSSQIHYIANEINLGISRGRNEAVKYATNRFLFFVDSDIVLCNNALDILRTDLSKYDVVIGGYNNEGKGLVWYREIKTRALSKKKIGDCKWQLDKNHFTTMSGGFFGIKKDIFDNQGGFDNSFEGGALEDLDLELRLLEQGSSIYYDGMINGKHIKDEMRWTLFVIWCWKCAKGNANVFKKCLISKKYKLPHTIYYPRIPIISFILLIALIGGLFLGSKSLLLITALFYFWKIHPFWCVNDTILHKLAGSVLFMLDELLTFIFFMINSFVKMRNIVDEL